MVEPEQQSGVIIFDNLVSASAGKEPLEKAANSKAANSVEPFHADNGAGSFRKFKDRTEIGEVAHAAGMRVRNTFQTDL